MRQFYFLSSYRSYLYFLIFPSMSFPWNNSCFDGNWRQKDGGIIYDSGNMSVRPAPRVLQTLAVKEKETIRNWLSFFFSVFCRTTGIKRLRYKRTQTPMSFNEKSKTSLPCISIEDIDRCFCSNFVQDSWNLIMYSLGKKRWRKTQYSVRGIEHTIQNIR